MRTGSREAGENNMHCLRLRVCTISMALLAALALMAGCTRATSNTTPTCNVRPSAQLQLIRSTYDRVYQRERKSMSNTLSGVAWDLGKLIEGKKWGEIRDMFEAEGAKHVVAKTGNRVNLQIQDSVGFGDAQVTGEVAVQVRDASTSDALLRYAVTVSFLHEGTHLVADLMDDPGTPPFVGLPRVSKDILPQFVKLTRVEVEFYRFVGQSSMPGDEDYWHDEYQLSYDFHSADDDETLVAYYSVRVLWSEQSDEPGSTPYAEPQWEWWTSGGGVHSRR